MSKLDIIALIKWLPLILFLFIFLMGLLSGMIKGRRKTIRRGIYVLLYVVLIFLLTPKICEIALDISFKGMTIEEHLVNFIQENEEINKIFNSIPGLKDLMITYPSAIVSLVLYLVLILIGLPLSFPIYWIYLIIYGLISKFVFKYSKYKRDENGKIVRNEKGKKIKIKRDKHRLTGGLIKGTQGVVLASTIFVPVGVVTRLYEDARDTTASKDLSSIEYFKDYKDIMDYINAFNNSVVGKVTNGKFNELVAGYLAPIKVEEDKSTLEKELSNVVIAAVYIEDSGLIKLLSENVDVKTLDLSKLKIESLEKAIECLFKSITIKSIVTDGINYVLEDMLNESLVDLTGDIDIVNKIKYSDANEVKQELLTVISVFKSIVNAKLLETYQNSNDDAVVMLNQVNTNDIETILNKVLSIKILSKSLPGIVNELLKNEGLTTKLKEENNSEFVKVLIKTLNFIKSVELVDQNQFDDKDVFNSLVDNLYKDGAIKTNTKDALAELLASINSNVAFSEVLTYQLNKVLEDSKITLNAKMITNINTKEDWNKEILVLEDLLGLYKQYDKDNTVDFSKVNGLLNKIKDTRAIILTLPIAYKEVFPSMGIEVDLEKIKYIDYSSSNASEEERAFYDYWKQELVHLENISSEFDNLNMNSIEDISLDLLDEDKNVDSLATIISEIFSSDLLKDGITKILDESMNDLLKEYDVTLNENAISNVNNVVNTTPYYIVVDSKEYNVDLVSDKYFILNEEVSITSNKVTYKGNEYDLITNTLKRVWKSDLTNLANIVRVAKNGDFTTRDNLTIVLDSIDYMYLLKDVKNDLLLYAVKELNVLPKEDYDAIDKEAVSFSNEKNILLNIIDKYETLENISSINFETMTDTEIDDIAFVLENIMDSNVFSNYVANTIVDLASSSGVTLTADEVKSSDSWNQDLTTIKRVLTLNIVEDGFDLTETINDSAKLDEMSEILANSLSSNLLKGSVSNTLVDIFKTNGIKHDLDNEDNSNLTNAIFGVGSKENWKKELSGIKDLLSVSSKDNLTEEVFTTIEESTLLGGCKANIMIKMVEEINKNITDNDDKLTVPSVGVLIENDYTQYKKEKDAILTVTTNLDSIDIASDGFSLDSTLNDETKLETMASILDKSLNSIIFKDTMTKSLLSVFESNGIKHDFNTANNNLTTDILSVGKENNPSWKDELTNIKDLLAVNNKEELTSSLFTTIEESTLLGGCKANILIKMVNEVNNGITDVDDKLTVPSLGVLIENDYTQYKIEKAILLKATDIDNINASNIDDENKETISSLLNGMKSSVIFNKQYDKLINEIGDTITSKNDNVSIENNPNISDWKDELDILLNIRDTVETLDTIKITDAGVTSTIATILDNMDKSELISNDSSRNVANTIVTRWNNNTPTTITKLENQTWEEAFTAKINELKGA